MASNAYFQDELHYLRDVGPEFARTNPEIARTLADRGADPDVERVLEGTAFLCGRIREKLDDELPELTANMMSLLWPHYLRPIPSMSIVEFRPEIEAMQAPLHVAPGAALATVPVDGTRCLYRTCWPTVLRPWVLSDLKLETAASQPVRLVLRFQTAAKAKLADLDLSSVRIHLPGDPRVAFVLYLLLAAHVDQVTASGGSGGHNAPRVELGPGAVAAAGLDRNEAVLPYPQRSFAGYRLLQEYFAFKERFRFFDLKGLDRAVNRLQLENTLELAITFNRRLDTLPMVGRDDVRLHCVPVINLLNHPADPIRLQHDRTEYLIQPSRSGVQDRRHLEVYSVDQVMGLVRGESMETREYLPFFTFRHSRADQRRATAYYQTHVRRNVLGGNPRLGTDTYVSFVADDTHKLPDEETISVELTCTNRHLPEGLRAGDICEPTDSSPANTQFRNLSKPTSTVSPPLGQALHWRLISHMSLNYVSLADADHFRELLRVYDFQAEHDAQHALAHQRMLDGILSVSSQFSERMVRGAVLRGSQVNLEINEDHFAGEGDALLFSIIVERFMALYATLNAFTQLTVRFARSGRVHRFPPRWGEQIIPAESREEPAHA